MSRLNFLQGCGKGYDVVMLALHGFDVIGLEVSQKGVSVAEEYSHGELQKPQEYNFGAAWTNKYERGSVSSIHGDFFQPECASGEKFDVIYDYTVCIGIHGLLTHRLPPSVPLCSSSDNACSVGFAYG